MFDVNGFFQDFSVSYISEGDKHCQAGWVQTGCPFCTGNPGYHLGYNKRGDYFNCWRCGWHATSEVVQELGAVDWKKAKEIISEYQTVHIVSKTKSKRFRADELKLPSGCKELTPRHRRYLSKRDFDADDLIENWDLKGTGIYGSYKYRIIAPIYYNNRLVSYQGRDYTNKSQLKYKACKQENEVIDHKNVLYGLDKVESNSVVVVEGITDVWRLGPGAVATFGIKYKTSQVILLAERFQEVYIMYDDDPQAILQAEKLAYDLSMFGLYVEIILIKGDPGDLPQRKANKIMNNLLW